MFSGAYPLQKRTRDNFTLGEKKTSSNQYYIVGSSNFGFRKITLPTPQVKHSLSFNFSRKLRNEG
jgi:hypothetical protein